MPTEDYKNLNKQFGKLGNYYNNLKYKNIYS